MINYSIIIPHKDRAELLEYCLKTIPVRDDVQVIVVDDNSNPDVVDFEHFPQWGGNNYETYFTKEGKGAGYARNIGLEHAKGKWLLFVDSDDFLLDNVGRIFDENINNDADVVFFRIKCVMLQDRLTVSSREDYHNRLIDEYFQNGTETLRTRCVIPSCKFVKRDLVEKYKIQFDEILYSNDRVFSVKVGVSASKISVKDESYYVITEHENSAVSNFCEKAGELECRADAFYRSCEIISRKSFPIDMGVAYFYLRMLLVQNRKLFVRYSKWLIENTDVSKPQLIKDLFRSNSFKSRIKRSIYTFFVLR